MKFKAEFHCPVLAEVSIAKDQGRKLESLVA